MDDHTHWSNEEVAAGVKSMEEKKANLRRAAEKPESLKCPRCTSSHTKFCYYNNYNLSQPRYFCKTCRRYWTAGGSLRNVPVGGASRKNKRSSSYDHMMMIMPPAHDDQTPSSQNPSHHHHIIQNHGSTDNLNMGFFKTSSSSTSAGNDYATGNMMMMMMNSFMPMPLVAASSHVNPMNNMVCVNNGFQNDDADENSINNNHPEDTTTGGDHDPSTGTARVFFPLEDLKPNSSESSTTGHHQMQGHDHHSNSYWSRGGSW